MELWIGGITLASLFHQLSSGIQKNHTDLEGLLFGTVSNITSKTTSDSQFQEENRKYVLAIQDTKIQGVPPSFYNEDGILTSDGVSRIEHLMKIPGQGKLLGWFKFRRNSSLRPSMREIIVHSQLEQVAKQHNKAEEAHPFLFGIFSMSSTTTKSTHTFDYRFLSISNNTFLPVEANITNLVHSSQTEYKDFTSFAPYYSTTDLRQIVSTMSQQSSQLETFIEQRLQQLNHMANQVHNETSQIRLLEEEVKGLEMNLSLI